MNSSLFCSENSLFILKSRVKARAFCLHLEFDFEYCKSNIYADQVIKVFVFEKIYVYLKRSISQSGLNLKKMTHFWKAALITD